MTASVTNLQAKIESSLSFKTEAFVTFLIFSYKIHVSKSGSLREEYKNTCEIIRAGGEDRSLEEEWPEESMSFKLKTARSSARRSYANILN